MVLDIYPKDAAADLRSLHAGFKEIVSKLKEVEKLLADGKKVTREKLLPWQAQLAALVGRGWTAEKINAVVFAAPQHWPRLAAILDPTAFQKAKPRLLVAQAQAALREKDFQTAQKQFQGALALEPDNVAALEGLARTCGQIDAIAYYRDAVKRGRANPETCNNLACCFCKLGDLAGSLNRSDRALALWAARRAVALVPLGCFWDTLAEVLEKIGDLPGALAATREALRDDPDRDDFRKRLQSCAPNFRPCPRPLPMKKANRARIANLI